VRTRSRHRIEGKNPESSSTRQIPRLRQTKMWQTRVQIWRDSAWASRALGVACDLFFATPGFTEPELLQTFAAPHPIHTLKGLAASRPWRRVPSREKRGKRSGH
jgi:hypothetical protein